MKIGIISVFTDYHRRGAHHRGVLQPQIGPLIAALLPAHADVDVINDAWDDPDWSRRYDLLFISCLHSDFDRARQISHYWRRRGAKTVLGGTMASTYAALCAPYFDVIAVGDPEGLVAQIVADFEAGVLQDRYVATPFDAQRVPHPRLDLAARQQVLPLAIEATRGCPFTCEFCALTGIGTRFHTRPAAAIAKELTAGRRALAGLASWLRRHVAIFYDNNLGGNPAHMRAICAALAPLGIRWGACVTFNVICDEQNVKALAAGGCRCVFVGLESFNRDTIREMGKHQNVLAETQAAIRLCHDNGILVMAGLMLSPLGDSLEYIESIPAQLRAVGLHVPTYICFETPFPGTPHFARLAAAGGGGGQLRRQGWIGPQELGRRRGGGQPQGAAAPGHGQAGRYARWLRRIGPGGGYGRDRRASRQQQGEQKRAGPALVEQTVSGPRAKGKHQRNAGQAQHAGDSKSGWMIAMGAAIRQC